MGLLRLVVLALLHGPCYAAYLSSSEATCHPPLGGRGA